MHAVGGDALGALAEKQVQSPYSRKCHVSRRLGEYLVDRIRSKAPARTSLRATRATGRLASWSRYCSR
jgi:hypothetical protein